MPPRIPLSGNAKENGLPQPVLRHWLRNDMVIALYALSSRHCSGEGFGFPISSGNIVYQHPEFRQGTASADEKISFFLQIYEITGLFQLYNR